MLAYDVSAVDNLIMQAPTQFRDPELDTSGEAVGFYPREFYMLDNFSSFQVEYAGVASILTCS
jgi:hypothetical protein